MNYILRPGVVQLKFFEAERRFVGNLNSSFNKYKTDQEDNAFNNQKNFKSNYQ